LEDVDGVYDDHRIRLQIIITPIELQLHVFKNKNIKILIMLFPDSSIAVCMKKSNPSLESMVAPTTVAAGRGLLARQGRQPLTDADIRVRIAARLKVRIAS
jgi:hypothetical protein